jgi:hypothetical protein
MGKKPFIRKTGRSCEISQEIILKPDGTLLIPWITPDASKLVREIWRTLNEKVPFPILSSDDKNIYCG